MAIGSLVTSDPEPRLPGLFSLRLSCRYTSIMLRIRSLPAGFIPPCLPTKADVPPSGILWLHEIKHDGFRVIARKIGAQVRLYSRPGNDLTDRFRLIVETLANLRTRSCITDGEAVGQLTLVRMLRESTGARTGTRGACCQATAAAAAQDESCAVQAADARRLSARLRLGV